MLLSGVVLWLVLVFMLMLMMLITATPRPRQPRVRSISRRYSNAGHPEDGWVEEETDSFGGVAWGFYGSAGGYRCRCRGRGRGSNVVRRGSGCHGTGAAVVAVVKGHG